MRTLEGEMPLVVTGLGVVAPNGIGVDKFWNGLLNPTPGSMTPTYAVGEIDHEMLPPIFRDSKALRRMDNFSIFALAAYFEAAQQAGLSESVDPLRMGVVISTGDGGEETREADITRAHGNGVPNLRRVPPFHVPGSMPNAAAAHVSRAAGARGPSECGVEACASGTLSIAKGLRMLRLGEIEVAIIGASEATANAPYALAGFSNMTALSRQGISRPFDRDRDGFIPGEGAGVMIVETLESAQRRGAVALAEFVGYGSSSDCGDITQPDENGLGLRLAIRQTLDMAELWPEDIGYINAHGTSTPLNDAVEALVFREMFPNRPYITSIKGNTGHALGAAGALEAVATVLSVRGGVIPPINNIENVDPAMESLRLVRGQPEKWQREPNGRRVALSVSAAFGGHNGTVAIAEMPQAA